MVFVLSILYHIPLPVSCIKCEETPYFRAVSYTHLDVYKRQLMDRPLEPPNFVVDTLISQGLHILAGSPKVGKSWLALWLAVTVAKGEPVWGMSVKQGTTCLLYTS